MLCFNDIIYGCYLARFHLYNSPFDVMFGAQRGGLGTVHVGDGHCAVVFKVLEFGGQLTPNWGEFLWESTIGGRMRPKFTIGYIFIFQFATLLFSILVPPPLQVPCYVCTRGRRT